MMTADLLIEVVDLLLLLLLLPVVGCWLLPG
jgi:hypothetical protein